MPCEIFSSEPKTAGRGMGIKQVYIYIYINKIIRVKNKSVAGSLNMYTVIVIYSRNRKEGGRRQAFFDPALKRVLC